MQLPLGCYSVSIKAMETPTVWSVKYSENSRAVQAQAKGLPSSVSCLQQSDTWTPREKNEYSKYMP